MPGIQLSEPEQVLRDRLAEIVETFESSGYREVPDAGELLAELATKGHELHNSLAGRNNEPRHHKYMIANRGMEPVDPRFYGHIHPVQDLLKWIGDSSANVDPEDQTIGSEFTMKVFSRRWGHDDTYRMKRTATGWYISRIAIDGDCDKRGNPVLRANLHQDSVFYPRDIGGWLEWLWDRAAEDGLAEEQVQAALDELGEWISETEKRAPSGGVWSAYA